MGEIVNLARKVVPIVEVEDAVWFAGGSLHAKYGAHVRHVEPEWALRRRDFWGREAARLGFDPTREDARHAARQYLALTQALDALDRHNRIVGKPSPYADPHAEAESRWTVAAKAEPNSEPPSAA